MPARPNRKPEAERRARLQRTIRRGEMMTVTATEAQNGFGRVLDAVSKDGTVLITKHDVAQAVVISADRYEALTRGQASPLDDLAAEFDAMLERMQSPESKEAMRAAFGASPDELGEAAFNAAQPRRP
jgi:antitoxin Phd